MSDWNLIETAPRDGTVMLLAYAEHSLSGYSSCVRPAKRIAVGLFDGLWRVGVPDGGVTGGGDDQFTHWMPLPSPPLTD